MLVCVPCAQFLNQESPDASQVHGFIQKKLGPDSGSFMVPDTMDVNGSSMHPVYHFLKSQSKLYSERRHCAEQIPWNYGKFLVDPLGRVMDYLGPTESPLSLEPKI